ncbi:MAG: hypothetical protein OXJ62_04295 [Spirochaetaceae bacterium]|nr:hypothetical protein [Spirochaetaceae bacterium]
MKEPPARSPTAPEWMAPSVRQMEDEFCVAGIGAARAEGDYLTSEVGSGDYQFQAAAHVRMSMRT